MNAHMLQIRLKTSPVRISGILKIMRNFMKRSVASIFALVAIFGLAPSVSIAQQGPLPVSVAKPIVQEIVEWDEYTGRFEAVERVDVVARVSGFLESVHFKEGDVVSDGQLLFIIDPRPFEAQRQAAAAAVAATRTRLDLAEKELKRAERLVKRNNISQELVDQRRAAMETARTDVLAALAELRIADLDVEFTKVKAPFRGRISDTRIDVGNYVDGGNAQATLLSTIVSMDPILFTFTASEAEFLKYSRLHLEGRRESSRVSDNPVYVRLMDETEFTRKGRMHFVDNELSPETATIRGQAIFDNPLGLLTLGVFGRLRLLGSDKYQAVLMPDAAIISDQGRKLALVVDAEGTVGARVLELGPIHNGLRVIRRGIKADDRVIIRGVQRARPGGKVIPQEMTLNPDATLSPASGS